MRKGEDEGLSVSEGRKGMVLERPGESIDNREGESE